MATITKKAAPGKTLAMLAGERRARVESLRQRWALLVHKSASGEELSAEDVDTLGDAAEEFELADIEKEFNSDVELARWVAANQKTVDDIKSEGLPQRMEALTADIERLQAEIVKLRGLHAEARIRHQSWPAIHREIEDRKSKNSRIYGGANNAD
jgi:hypothetical protein